MIECKREIQDAEESSSEQQQQHEEKQQQNTVICLVCGAPAPNFRFYGGVSCHSCRAFFKRTVNGRRADSYACRGGEGGCPVGRGSSRRACKACRFRGCLEAGMKPDLVLGEEAVARRAEVRRRKAEERRLKRQGTLAIMEVQPEEDLAIVRATVAAGVELLNNYYRRFYSANPHHFRELLLVAYQGQSFSLPHLVEEGRMCQDLAIAFMTGLEVTQ